MEHITEGIPHPFCDVLLDRSNQLTLKEVGWYSYKGMKTRR